MLISYKWLQKYIPDLTNHSPEEVAELLTISLAEVEKIVPVRHELESIIVGEVLRVEKHENSDKLKVCQVMVNDEDKLQIVCGAPNVAEKKKVAVCLNGGQVYADTKKNTIRIKTAVIRGVESSGMICSARELGLSDDHEGILILEDNLETGADLTEILKDVVYEIENKSLSHRGDCFSHKGIAREIAASLVLDFLDHDQNLDALIPSVKRMNLDIDINVNHDLCKRFSALLISNIEVKPSPLWMQSLLSAVGERSINNVVDITNYIMLDQGQPMHAYDYDNLAKNKLVVRKARSGEEMSTLDGVKRKLDNSMVVISDADKIENIAGIMGGEGSQITLETKTVLLEAANWDMFNIRKTSRQLGLRTEASTRFEKGLDPNMTLPALQASFTLISDLASGELAADIFDLYPSPEIEKEIELDINLVNRLLTLNLTKLEIIEILQRLQIKVVDKEASDGSDPNQEAQSTIRLKVPTYRQDLKIKEDLVEEVARIYGFLNLAPKLPERLIVPAKSYKPSVLFRKLTISLADLGFDEIKTYSFIGKDDYEKAKLHINNCLELANPIAPELKYIRNSLLPNLLITAKNNQPKYQDINIFEISRLVSKQKDNDGIHLQPWHLGVLINITVEEQNPYNKLKGVLEFISKRLNLKLQYTPGDNKHPNHEAFHPYRYANILFNDKLIGIIGETHPGVIFNYDLTGKSALLELNLEDLILHAEQVATYKALAAYPETARDLSFWVPDNVTYSEIEKHIHSLDIPLLKNLHLKDTYLSSENKPRRSITLTFTFQSDQKTLTDEEVSKMTGFISTELENKLKLSLRDS